jgi:hypothetical protein
MRTIKFVNDTGSPVRIEAPENLTVGQFIELLAQRENVSVNLSKVVLTELKSKAIFATDSAILPEGDLRLFTTIKDPKGNGKFDDLSRGELYTIIRTIRTVDGENADEHFNSYGNITQVSSYILIELLDEYDYTRKSRAAVKELLTGNVESVRPAAPKKTAASAGLDEDPDFAALRAAQSSFNPSLTRKS